MQLTFISDTHGKHAELNKILEPGGDVLIHCGDISNVGTVDEIGAFVRWFACLEQFKHKIFIAGNHDFGFENTNPATENIILSILEAYPNVTYLENSETIIDGIKFYGSPWTLEFNYWAFNANLEQLKDIWADIPEDTDVLITHGPVKGVLDKTLEGISAGDPELLQALKRVHPLIHAFGHIHEAYGTSTSNNGIVSVNASSLNQYYHFTNEPIIINI